MYEALNFECSVPSVTLHISLCLRFFFFNPPFKASVWQFVMLHLFWTTPHLGRDELIEFLYDCHCYFQVIGLALCAQASLTLCFGHCGNTQGTHVLTVGVFLLCGIKTAKQKARWRMHVLSVFIMQRYLPIKPDNIRNGRCWYFRLFEENLNSPLLVTSLGLNHT